MRPHPGSRHQPPDGGQQDATEAGHQALAQAVCKPALVPGDRAGGQLPPARGHQVDRAHAGRGQDALPSSAGSALAVSGRHQDRVPEGTGGKGRPGKVT